MNGYNFTERVRKVLAMAREEAGRLHHEYVGTEHLLLGLLREGEGVAATVLQNLAVDVDALSDRLDSIVKKGKGGTPGPDLPYTSRAKKVLELAMTQARELDHSYVGTEHLLLGLLAEQKGIAAQVLTDLGVTLEKATAETLKVLGTQGASSVVQQRPATQGGLAAIPHAQLSDRVRDVMRDAEHVATEFKASELMPIHVAIALLRSHEGLANAILDRFDVDRAALLQALTNEARNVESPSMLEPRLTFGEYMIAFQRQVESESRWRSQPSTTLNILLALLDTVKEVALIFDTEGVDAARVRAEARRMSG